VNTSRDGPFTRGLPPLLRLQRPRRGALPADPATLASSARESRRVPALAIGRAPLTPTRTLSSLAGIAASTGARRPCWSHRTGGPGKKKMSEPLARRRRRRRSSRPWSLSAAEEARPGITINAPRPTLSPGPSLPCMRGRVCRRRAPLRSLRGPARPFMPCPHCRAMRPSPDPDSCFVCDHLRRSARSGVFGLVDQAAWRIPVAVAKADGPGRPRGVWRAPRPTCAVALVLTCALRAAAPRGRRRPAACWRGVLFSAIFTGPVTAVTRAGARGARSAGYRLRMGRAADDIARRAPALSAQDCPISSGIEELQADELLALIVT